MHDITEKDWIMHSLLRGEVYDELLAEVFKLSAVRLPGSPVFWISFFSSNVLEN